MEKRSGELRAWGIAQLEKLEAKLEDRKRKKVLHQKIDAAVDSIPVETGGLSAILPGMDMNKYSEAYQQGAEAAMKKYGLSLYDLLGLLPGGAVIEGAIKPSEGASRAETIALGGGGGLLGTALGGLGGAALTSKMTGEEPDQQLEFSLPAAGIGAIGGGAIGNIIGRWLAERKKSPEAISLEEIKAVIEQAKAGQSGSNVTINMAEPAGTPVKEINKET